MLDGVEIDIDFWPMIPAYVEFEAESEENIKKVCAKLGIEYESLVSIGVTKIYKYYGIDFDNHSVITLEEERKNINFIGENEFV